jgi:hypothetical protein
MVQGAFPFPHSIPLFEASKFSLSKKVKKFIVRFGNFLTYQKLAHQIL